MVLDRDGRRWHLHGAQNPSTQNLVAGVGVGFSAGVFVSLNLLGAGGGRPESAHVIQTANAILSSVWFLSACVGGTYLNFFGPAITMSFGICTYILYVGSLWYYEAYGRESFPLAAGAIIGVGAGAVWITSGYIQVAYSDDSNKGKFIAIQNTIQATSSILCSILPVILNRNNDKRAGVPAAIYITFIIVMGCAALLALLTLRRLKDLESAENSTTTHHEKHSTATEFKANLSIVRDWQLLMMLPAFLPAGSFLIYLGSVNAFQNNLRVRSLVSFVALIVQIPFGHLLHFFLDHPGWSKRKRGLIGLAFVGVPLCAAWMWEIIRTRGFDRSNPPSNPLDWNDSDFGPVMVLFVLNWTFSILWQYLVPWLIGALTMSPDKLSHYMGAQRGFLAAGEAVCFGVDSIKIPYVTFASAIFDFYLVGIFALAYLCIYYVTEKNDSLENEHDMAVSKIESVNGKGTNCKEKAEVQAPIITTSQKPV
ncbi:uncharacterized protein BCR38DRAFT_431019 [Pseudomassariella vexata]|uniref:Major facilitator superfamily domain-containing protein n=1 Tax=Pseudomassariella vexata TaxID=1141098 RepID=A0A1Y2E1P6_9PEZI|nr:uncharacterized protein BCR38DRAFT_431019 [Pseudomassariella vexata]ORY64795.1 hypothetical protein BCR38DRAFT_431019 [Pseudomassariella vexata]